MWAHYAASHRGFVIGFKPGYAPLKKRTNEQYLSEGELQPVTYVQARVTLPADRIALRLTNYTRKGSRGSMKRSGEWSGTSKNVMLPCLLRPAIHGYFSVALIRQRSLESILVSQASDETKTALRDATARGSRLEHVHLYQAHLNAGRITLAFKPLN
jgi:hypothetical protein